MKKQKKYILTIEMKKRIRSTQEKLGLKAKDVAEAANNMQLSTYYNITRLDKKNGNQTISEKQLGDLSIGLDCTVDFLLCKSDDPQYMADGKGPIIRPLNSREHSSLMAELDSFLNENHPTLRNLHFLFCEMPQPYIKQFQDVFDTVVRILRLNPLWERAKYFSSESFSKLIYVLENEDPDLIEACKLHSDALEVSNSAIKTYNSKKAIALSLKVILITITKNHKAITFAHDSVRIINNMIPEVKNKISFDFVKLEDTLTKLENNSFFPNPEDTDTISSFLEDAIQACS